MAARAYLESRGRQRVPEPERTDPEMTHPEQDPLRRDRQLEQALDHAHCLSQPRPRDQYTPEWWAQASWVGDMTALAALDLVRSLHA
jgi:hypothetical protein